ncbi:FixH family protein [Shinella sp. CPCC 101442]|uniref:FixH family protein n=1 Tax=Shinella sp. CPCC 101442 TaxID=2932265 RepID=UPI002152D24E|nr:FixH family protein [Shinella sp. CPCC 101442]MCR6499750.1 FixH family protein [Shinella sp. CPCC 101442]
MATGNKQQQGFVFTGWHMLGIMVLFFGTIITVNLIMAWNASNSWSGLVVQNTYVASQQFNGKVAEAKAFAASGIEGNLTIEAGRVTYRVVDAKGEPVIANDIIATFKRPVDEREDFTLALESEGLGLFVAERDITAGQWIVDISTKRDGTKVFHQTVRTVVAGGAK